MKWKTEKGQLKLGEHSCYAVTAPTPRTPVLGDDKADITDRFTLRRELRSVWRAEAGMTVNENKLGKVQNDDIADWTPAWQLFDGDVCYVYHAGAKAERFSSRSRFRVQHPVADHLVEGQDGFVSRRLPLATRAVLVRVRDGKKGNEDRKTNLADYGVKIRVTVTARKSRSSVWHGRSKPLHHGLRTVSGSGTTIIACEQLDKECRAIEIDPNYVAVALERYVYATGKEPVLLNARD